ncbi:MAG: class II aldolase/adducin family protein [Spirochaetaceae bacterium]|nr:class II aldolase/adducin family protein [Spirochaetaceae bacterium]
MGSLDALVALSRRYGADPGWVLAGGGNTSLKIGRSLYVKASGSALATIGEDGFCAIDLDRLDAVWSASYPEGTEAREEAALADLMAARVQGEAKRPSVETLMHGLFPQSFVVHTHPSIVNGLACSKGGKAAFDRLFGEDGIWVPFVDPGYILAKTVRSALEAFRERKGRAPSIMLMQNHGLLVAADETEGIDELSRSVVERIRTGIHREPDLAAVPVDMAALSRAAEILRELAAEGAALRFLSDAETTHRASGPESFAAISSAFTPDHIVYAGHEFLFSAEGIEGMRPAWSAYRARNGSPPRVALVRGLGAFAVASSDKAADAAIALYADALKVAAYSESFGGPLHMTKEKIDFIRNWEVEKYRSKVGGGA